MNDRPAAGSRTPSAQGSSATRSYIYSQGPRQLTEAMIVTFYRTLRATTIYDSNNAAIQQLFAECHHIVSAVLDMHSYINLRVVRENIFFNGARLHVTADSFASYKALINELRKYRLGEIEFNEGLRAGELIAFFYMLNSLPEDQESNYLSLKMQLQGQVIDTIDVEKLESFEDTYNYLDSEKMKRQSREIYFSTISMVKELMEATQSSRLLNVRKIKRMMLNTVDMMMHDSSTLLGLTNIKNYDDYTFNHSVNVAIYAIALGMRLGLPKKHLNFLGIAGLFHDIGKLAVAKDVLNKPGTLTPEEWEIIQTHPVRGAGIILNQRGWGELSTRAITTALEHHIKYDKSGYPNRTPARQPVLFSRIISIADCYDAMGRPRIYRSTPSVSEKALGMILERSGTDFDPILVKIFTNMIGIYPIGSVVELDTGEMAIVYAANPDPELIDRPRVCLLEKKPDGYHQGLDVDLTAVDPQSNRYLHNIVKTIDPNEYDIPVEEMFF